MNILSLFLGAAALSIVHALIPNHWVPFIIIGNTKKRSRTDAEFIKHFLLKKQ